jgi:hypothetical protein
VNHKNAIPVKGTRKIIREAFLDQESNTSTVISSNRTLAMLAVRIIPMIIRIE